MGRKRLPGNLTKRKCVVIADDSPEMLDAIERQISQLCQIVARVQDGVELINQVREHEPDLVITDISMPRMTGIEALRQLRAQGLNTPAVIVSVHEDGELVKAGLAEGASGFVLKSHLNSDLLVAVRAALEGKVFISERLRKKIS
jgi:DNA-binding NarL/FixJ family response regulator